MSSQARVETRADASSEQHAAQQLRALLPLVHKLNASLTCSICLDVMHDAHQLQCSHIFCAACVKRMLAMRDVRCAVCKQKSGKRMLSPLISFAHAAQTLRALQQIVAECGVAQQTEARADQRAVNDGFDAALSSALERIREVQRQQQLRLQRIEQNGDAQTTQGPPETCMLCPRGVDPSFFPRCVKFGPLKQARSMFAHMRIFAHESCAMFTPHTWLLDDVVHGIEPTVMNARLAQCEREACGRTRASVPCCSAACHKKYHFACAAVDGCVLVEDGYKMYCAQHAHEAPRIDDSQFRHALSDPAGNVCKAHDDVCYICRVGGRLLMCDSCERCTHAACSGLRSIPQGSWNCAVCTGTQPNAPPTPPPPPQRARAPSRKRARAEAVSPAARAHAPSGAKRTRTKMTQPRRKADTHNNVVLSHTGLRDGHRELLRKIAKKKKTTMSDDVDRRVTHVVIQCFERSDTPLRTMKLCKAIASRARIVCWTWIVESHTLPHWAPFERHLHPLSWAPDRESVYAHLRFSFACYNGPREKRDDLVRLVQMGGGTVVQGAAAHGAHEPQLMYVREEDGKKSARREQPARLEPPRGARVVMSTWLLDLCTKNRAP